MRTSSKEDVGIDELFEQIGSKYLEILEQKEDEKEDKLLSNSFLLTDSFEAFNEIIKIYTFSASDKMDIINRFLEQQKDIITKKNIKIFSVLDLNEEYNDIKDINFYFLFIDLEKEKKQLTNEIIKIINYMEKYCDLNKKFFIFGIISENKNKNIKSNKEELMKIFEDHEFKYEYKDINLSEKNEIPKIFSKIFKSEENTESEKTENEDNFDISINFNPLKNIKECLDIKFSDIGLKYFNKSIKNKKIGIIRKEFFSKSPLLMPPKLNIFFEPKMKYITFSSQGFDNPILEEKNIDQNDIKNNKNNDKDINVINKEHKNIMNNYFDLNFYENMNDLENNKIIEELKINKQIFEEFMIRFIIDYCEVVMITVGILTYSDQVMIKKIMDECIKRKKNNLIILHILEDDLKDKESINDYIKNILMKNALFDLEPKDNLSSEEENENSEDINYIEHNSNYYTSVYKSTLNIMHFISTNDKVYKSFYKDMIQFFFINSPIIKTNISQGIKKELSEVISDYTPINQNMKIEIEKPEDYLAKILIKSDDEKIALKKYYKSKINKDSKSDIKLNYSLHISEKNEKKILVISIEDPGITVEQQINVTMKNSMYVVTYKGKKILDEEEKNIINIGRASGDFVLDIPIALTDYIINNIESPNHYDKNGIKYIEYELKNISNIAIDIKKNSKKENEK